jgi:hypothetical protein
MPVALLSTPVSMTVEQYDRIIEQLEACGSGAPPGRRFHVCFGPRSHVMLFDVWDSTEDFLAFRATLMPILANEQVSIAPPEPLEIHRLVEGGDAGALRRTIAALRESAFFRRPVEKLREKIHTRVKPSEEEQGGGAATT